MKPSIVVFVADTETVQERRIKILQRRTFIIEIALQANVQTTTELQFALKNKNQVVFLVSFKLFLPLSMRVRNWDTVSVKDIGCTSHMLIFLLLP